VEAKSRSEAADELPGQGQELVRRRAAEAKVADLQAQLSELLHFREIEQRGALGRSDLPAVPGGIETFHSRQAGEALRTEQADELWRQIEELRRERDVARQQLETSRQQFSRERKTLEAEANLLREELDALYKWREATTRQIESLWEQNQQAVAATELVAELQREIEVLRRERQAAPEQRPPEPPEKKTGRQAALIHWAIWVAFGFLAGLAAFYVLWRARVGRS
jgi:hypothetical protein